MTDKHDPEKLQKDMMEALQHMLRQQPVRPASEAERKQQEGDEKRREQRHRALKFDLKPKEVKKHLDRFIIKQEEAKRVLATTVCDHYNHVKTCSRGEACTDYVKQNVLLLGPTGVGKTYLIKKLADLIGVPFVKSDATKFSETGYVGRDVDDLVRDLVQRADGDLELAQYGIIYLDEVDKIARASNMQGRDVSGGGVQQGLLKIMEETEVAVRNPQDIQSQMEALAEFQQKGKLSRHVINTRHVLFIVSGAFVGLEGIVRKRTKSTQIGFRPQEKKEQGDKQNVLRQARTEDFIEYGFEPEFVGRLPVRAVCDELTSEDLYAILTTSEGSVLKQYRAAFGAYDIDMHFQEKALWEIAKRAVEEKTGARGLVTVSERVLRDLKYELPSSGLRQFTLTPDMVIAPVEAVTALLEEERRGRRGEMLRKIHEFEEQFTRKNGMRITFDEVAMRVIQEEAIERDEEIGTFLQALLSNYHYGLGLIQKKKPRQMFVLTEEVIRRPNEVLDQWIKDTYEGETL